MYPSNQKLEHLLVQFASSVKQEKKKKSVTAVIAVFLQDTLKKLRLGSVWRSLTRLFQLKMLVKMRYITENAGEDALHDYIYFEFYIQREN